MANNVFLFAGPSLFGVGDVSGFSNLTWLPPAKRGDIEKLVSDTDTPGVIGLADGTFHDYPSVSHVELREAMQAGWRVYGLCSMGAIRVCELQHMGMIPWGRVAQMFCTDPNFADDEVALIHGATAPFVPLSEPLIHIREFCAYSQAADWLTEQQNREVIHSMRERWYGERTIKNLRLALLQALNVAELPKELMAASNNFAPFRIKQADLLSFINEQPWVSGRSI